MLAQEWTLSVRDFGQIKSADVTMAPLMVFAGRNSTGKSHLASLFWAISQPGFLANFLASCNNEKISSMKQVLGGRQDQTLSIDSVLEALNCCFAENAAALVSALLFVNSVSVQAAITISRNLSGEKLEVMPVSPDRTHPHVRFPGHIRMRVRLADVLRKLISPAQYAYLPAGRTGLTLSLRALLSGLLADDLSKTIRLPKPTREFLTELISYDGEEKSSHSDIIDILERDILHGRITSENVGDDLPSLGFDINGKNIPLHATSSLVTEIAPFVMLLKSATLDNGFIFEEPEAHLHLDAQRALARALARLLNRGVPMILTTHSDTFLQQLNIQMWLHEHPKREELMQKLGYAEDELIDPKMARGYHFEPEDGGTVVYEMDKRHEGLVVPSMNKVIYSMRDEIVALQDAED